MSDTRGTTIFYYDVIERYIKAGFSMRCPTKKVKLLITMVLDTAHGASDGVQSLVREELKPGRPSKKLLRRCEQLSTFVVYFVCILRRVRPF